MRTRHYLVTIHLTAIATVASLPSPSDALNTFNLLLDRHATGCSHSTTWQGGAESNANRICTNGTSLSSVNDSPINKTDCQALIQQISGKSGTGHWDVQWTCDGDSPDVLGSSGACGFAVDDVTGSNANTVSPLDVIEFINQAMEMFPNNDTMYSVTGDTACNNIGAQTIGWRVGSSSSTSGAAAVQPRWSWLCLVGTLVVGLSFHRSL